MPPILLPPELDPTRDRYGMEIARLLPTRDGGTVALPDRLSYVFVVFTNRSGSNYLCELLTSTGFFNPVGEPLNTDEVARSCAARGLASFGRYFAAIANEQRRNGHVVVKASIQQLAVLASHGILGRIVGQARFIVVERADKLAQAISWRIAQITGRYTSLHADTGQVPDYDGAALRQDIAGALEDHAAIDRFMALNGLVPFKVTYEMLTAHPEAVGRMLCDFLGLPDLVCDPGRIRLARQATELNRQWRARLLAEQAALAAPVQAAAVAHAAPRAYRRATLEQIAADPELRIGGQPRAIRAEYLPAHVTEVPPPAFGSAGPGPAAPLGFRVVHPAVPAWLLREAVVHGAPGVVTLGDRVVAEALDGVSLHPIPGAERMADGGVRLAGLPETLALPDACHLLGAVPGAYPSWLLDTLARFPPGIGTAPAALTPPAGPDWMRESLAAVLHPGAACRPLPGDGRATVQRLIYVPRLGGPDWATHPAAVSIFAAARDAIAGPGGRAPRRLFVANGDAAVLDGEARFAAAAQAAGFEVIEPAAMPFAGRVRAFAEASHIVAAGGPALANLVFCRPGATVCELRTEGQLGWTWRHLAALCDLRYGCVVVPPGPLGADSRAAFAAVLEDRRFRGG